MNEWWTDPVTSELQVEKIGPSHRVIRNIDISIRLDLSTGVFNFVFNFFFYMNITFKHFIL